MNQKEIGLLIAKLRKKKKLTQEQLAEQLHVTNKTISRWENGNYMPDLSLLIPLCNILEITVDELLQANIKEKTNNHEEIIIYAIKKEKENKKKYLSIILFIILMTILLLYSIRFINLWTYLIFLISIIILLINKYINNKSIYTLIFSLLLIIYTIYSYTTYAGSVRACVFLMGHPIKAHTTGVYLKEDYANPNYKYFNVDNNIQTISGDIGYIQVIEYGPLKISSYYGY